MDLENLFRLQKDLDNHILEQHNLHGESLFPKKLLALQVELAELANETRCFKFWSNKQPSEKSIILEEYVDFLHFILTIGIEKNYTDAKLNCTHTNISTSITDQFLNLYVDINDFFTCPSKDHYITLFEDFLCLGKNLGLTDEEIEHAYYKKNDINHSRQDNGY